MAKTKANPKKVKVVRKLLIVRKGDCKADLIDLTGMKEFLIGEPLNISPLAWADESGMSHFGFKLEGMKLKSLEELNTWVRNNHFATLLDLNEDSDHEAALDEVGLRINELAE